MFGVGSGSYFEPHAPVSPLVHGLWSSPASTLHVLHLMLSARSGNRSWVAAGFRVRRPRHARLDPNLNPSVPAGALALPLGFLRTERRLSLPAHLFAVFSGSGRNSRHSAGLLAGNQTHLPLPPMGWPRLRSSTAAHPSRGSILQRTCRYPIQRRSMTAGSLRQTRFFLLKSQNAGIGNRRLSSKPIFS
jgi:hypothetical protein